MIGIYLITNTTNGKQYIGQSLNIKRRFAEHKAPKARGNNRLHQDIQEIGIDLFNFEIIEECSEEELNSRELYHIKSINPFYNSTGKKRTPEQRKAISVATKKWWDTLPEDKKALIISNNLKGPAKGHEVKVETRRKIGKAVSEAQKQRVRIVETGEIFNSIGELEKHLGACSGTVAAYRKGKIKTVKGFHVVECRD